MFARWESIWELFGVNPHARFFQLKAQHGYRWYPRRYRYRYRYWKLEIRYQISDIDLKNVNINIEIYIRYEGWEIRYRLYIDTHMVIFQRLGQTKSAVQLYLFGAHQMFSSPPPLPKINSLSIYFLNWKSCDDHENSPETRPFSSFCIMFPSFHHEMAIKSAPNPPFFFALKIHGRSPRFRRPPGHRCYASRPGKSRREPVIVTMDINHQWIGLRENLQETIDFPIKYGVFPLNMRY